MPTPIIFTITDAGRAAALDALNTGITLHLSQLGIGMGRYTPTTAQTALQAEVARFPLSGGDIEQGSQTLRFSAVLESGTTQYAFEVGLFTSTGVLFAVSSTVLADPLVLVTANISFVASFGLVLSDIPANVITVVTDPNAPLALVLHQQHLAAPNPHPQYTLMSLFQQLADFVSQLSEDFMSTQFQLLNDRINAIVSQMNAIQNNVNRLLPKVGDIKYTGVAMTAEQFTAAQAGGIWAAHSAGRVLIGAGTTTDIRGEELSFAIGNFAGEFKHVQSEAEMRRHNHTTDPRFNKLSAFFPDVESDPNFRAETTNAINRAGADELVLGTDGTGTAAFMAAATMRDVGNGDPMNVVQPYLVACCFICISV